MDWQLKWKLVRVLVLGVVATVLSANSQVPKVDACSGCIMFCDGSSSLCQPACGEGTAVGCVVSDGRCIVFGNCNAGGGGGVGGEGC
jgi:hypothetical protein